jgi:hypothetical protein
LAGHDGRLEAITVVPVPPDPGPSGADLREGADVRGTPAADRPALAFVEFLR